MTEPDQIRRDMPVVCSDGRQLGTADRVEGDYLRLSEDDQGEHHWIPLEWIAAIDEQVHIARSGQQAAEEWLSGPTRGARGTASAYGEPRAPGYS